MARKLRIQYEGAVYHLTMRGVERRRLFDEDAERERFVQRLGEAVEDHGVRLHLFCLMSRHRTCQAPAGRIAQLRSRLDGPRKRRKVALIINSQGLTPSPRT